MSHLTRRSFNALTVATGIGLMTFSGDAVWVTKVPEVEMVVPEIAAGYAVKLFTRQHKIINSVIQHIKLDWGQARIPGREEFQLLRD